jgi:hypothetical protein
MVATAAAVDAQCNSQHQQTAIVKAWTVIRIAVVAAAVCLEMFASALWMPFKVTNSACNFSHCDTVAFVSLLRDTVAVYVACCEYMSV